MKRAREILCKLGFLRSQFQVKGGRWVRRRDILDILGERRKYFVKKRITIEKVYSLEVS